MRLLPVGVGAVSSRPRTRGDCQDGPRPCIHVSCRHHLMVEVTRVGSLTLNGKRGGSLPLMRHGNGCTSRVDEFMEYVADVVVNAADTCALDLAERGGMSLEEIAQVLEVTRSRIEQIEKVALKKCEAEIALQEARDAA